MRRLLPALLAVGLLAACSDDGATSSSTPAGTGGEGTDPAGSGGTDDDATPATYLKPDVSIPAALPTRLVVTDLVEGSGPSAQEGDTVVVHYVGVRSADGTEFDNSYDRGEPFTVTIGVSQVIQGWTEGLVGVRQGMRRQLDIPADLAYGDAGAGDVILPGDALTFVVDVVAVLPTLSESAAPDVEVEGGDNVTLIEPVDLVVGTGAELTDGFTAVLHFVAYRADTGERLGATWGTEPVTVLDDPEARSASGLASAAHGMKVGGRRQAQIPYPLVFGGQGSEQLGLPQGVDLVVVLDLIAVY